MVHAGSYGRVKMYAVESTENWFDDFGSARLASGRARVELDPLFAETVNTTAGYHVFLTPLGDCALYVADKDIAGFEVRALGGVECSVDFDYRIVARRAGYEQFRMERFED